MCAAFTRATQNGAISTIFKMFKANISLVNDDKAYSVFYEKMIETSKKWNLMAIFYDEIHVLAGVHEGQFLHESGHNADILVSQND